MSYENICNICGANYEYVNGRWVCPACGAFKAEELSNEEVTLLYNAAQKLRLADFDDAEQAYADIVQKYPFNHEGYWGRLLSKYGIKYEEDFDGKKIPTCYATTIESILGDSDYKRATELAPPDVREYYAHQAEYIERVRKEWVEKASHEAPYDVFICYKDSDLANGIDRTQDSIAAQELYIHLMEQGYRVFFSRESLRDKAGEKYEPYIFNALSTAKVMLVYGTNPEFITSTWLKNEWTRYHKRILAGDKKQGSLVTICDGFAPSELPRLLSATQCFDATKRSFYSDLDKYVKKYTKEDEPAPVVVPALEGEGAAGAEVAEAPAAVEQKKRGKGKAVAIGVAVAAVIIAVLMVMIIPGLTSDPALESFEIREGAGGMTYISGYVGDGKKVVIPEKFNGGTVVGIEARAFDSMDTLTSITIPKTVQSIGANAFYGCTSVETIVIPDSVTSMGMSAFYGWTEKQTIIIEGKDTAPSNWNAKWLEGCDAKIVYGKLYVAFDPNGGWNKVDLSIHAEIDSEIKLPKGDSMSCEGFTFAGWSTDEKSSKAEYQPGDTFAIGKQQGIVFYAVWKPVKNKIVFDPNGGEGSMEVLEAYSKAHVELPRCTFTREGYRFLGWATTASSDYVKHNDGAYFTYGTAPQTTLYAVWEPAPRTIHIDPNGGVGEVQTFSIRPGDTLKIDSFGFTRQGYIFKGYTDSPNGELLYDSKELFEFVVPEGLDDLTLYFYWEARNYPLRFYSNDENGKTVTVQVGYETTIDLPDPGFSREGYKLIGWSTNNKVEDMTVEYEVNGKYTHKNMGTFYLYAVWAPMEYNVNFYANHPNAGGVMNSIQIALGSEAKLPACTFIYDGYMLAGWATAPDGEAVYDPEGLFKMTTLGDKVLYAIWKEMEYSIRYELGNHGVNHADNPAFYRASDGAITLKAPTREGYEFLGWFSDAEMTVSCDTIAADSLGEVTFWAKWHALPNTVIFDANGGEGSMNSVTADTDTVITLPLNTMTREDCTFMGWTTVLGGTEVEYADGAEFTMQSHGVTLYAVWKAQSYTISYDFAGGELPGAVTEYSHLTNSFTLGIPTREGYEFIGWSGTGIEGIQRTVMIPTGSKGERSYTANWQAKTHTIVFERYETYVEGTMNELSAKTGETIVLTANCFVNQGYVFKGWATEPNGAVTYTDGQTITMGLASMTLYPVWELKTPGLVFEGHYVTGYTGSSTEVIVPTYYQGIRIQYIREGAFRDKTHITSISLPKYISWIGENAFAGCTSLSKIDFAGQANRVSLSAFLNTAYYNDPANRVNGVFYFEGHLIAPIDLTISGNYVIPSGTKVIAAEAFKNCANLVTIFIPSSVKYVGANAFQNCSSLTIRYEDAEISTKWESSWNSSNCPVVFNYYEEYTDTNGVKYNLYPDGSAIVTGYTGTATELTLSLDGYTVKKIADGAFQNNGKLTKVTFVSGLVEIGANAFNGCYNLVEIVLPEGLEKIGENAFNECQRLTTITATGEASQILRASTVTPIKNFPSTLKQIGFRAFYGCNSLKVVFIPSTLQELRSDAFYGYENLIVYAQPAQQPQGWDWLNVTIKWGVDGVYLDAQDVVYALYADKTSKVMDYFGTATNFTIALDGYTVIEIGADAFHNADTLVSITIPEGVTKIGTNAFGNCDALKNVKLPSTLKVIDENAFSECYVLEGVTIPEGVTEIAAGAFNCCNGLLEVILPSTLTVIGDNAFYNCYRLPEITLPTGLLSIGNSAFQSCNALKSIFLPKSIEKIGKNAFSECHSLIIYAGAQSQPGAWSLNWDNRSWDGSSQHTVIWNYKTHLTADNGVTYIITNDNKAYVVSYEGTATELDLTLDGYTVVEIEPNAFDGCTTLQKIVLPEGLVKIGAYAFNDCTALVDIKLPSTLTTICDHAFNNCQGLKVIDISAGVTSVEEYAFWNCNNLTVYAGAASKPDGWSASWNNENRPVVWDVKEHLTADNGVIYIIRNDNTVVVSGYTGEPTELDLSLEGYTVTEIAARAFYDCNTLTKVTMPDTITKIGEYAFFSCLNLKSIKLSAGITELPPYILSNTIIEELIIPEGVTTIGEYAFRECYNLKHIELPNSLKTIEQYAFYFCNNIEVLYLPDGLTTIGGNAFEQMQMLSLIYIPDSVTSIGWSALCYNHGNLSIFVEVLEQPSDWNTVWNNTSRPVTWGVAGVYLDDQGVTYVLNNDKTATVVKYTGDTEEITLSVEGYTVTKIADNVFENNEKLKRVILLDGMLEIGYRAFYDADIESITIPDSVTTIGAQAFYNCQKLTGIKLPSNLTSLGSEAFYYCLSLTEINIPKGLEKVESQTFQNCEKVTSVTIEEGSLLSEIGNQAFAGCVRLESINLPATLKTIGNTAFENCDRLISIVIPEGVTSIGNYAFNCCELLENVTLPSTLTSIGEWAFQSCSALKSISIPAGVETIGEGAFSSCSVLSSLEIAEGVKHIGKDAFRYCHALRSVVLPNSILTIGEYAFSNNNINTVFIPASVTEIDQYAFFGNSNLTIYASAESQPENWDSFWNRGDRPVVWGVAGIVTDAQGVVYRLMNDNTAIVIGFTDKGVTDIVIGLEGYTVTEIGARAFENVASIKSVAIPAGVTKIGEYAFSNCSALTSVTFPSTLVTIENHAFNECTNLNGAVLPESLTTVGEHAFWHNKTNAIYIPASVTTIGSEAFGDYWSNIKVFCKTTEVARPTGWNGNCFVNATIYYGIDGVYTDNQGLVYQLFDNNQTARLIGYTTEAETYVIPATVNGYNVTAIGEAAFLNNTAVKRITIPASVTSVAGVAFRDCYQLIVIVEMDEQPEGWAENWILYCLGAAWGTDKVHVDDQGVAYALYSDNTAKVIGCPDGLSSITIPATVEGCKVTEIADRAFQNRTMITSVTLPDGLLKIGDYAFASVHSLSGITLPDTLTHIGEYAFGYCNNVQKTIFIPASVTTIEENAFYDGYFSWIYTAHKSKPDGWDVNWNSYGYSVAWDYEGFVTDSQGVTYLLHPDKTASVYSYNGSAKELTFFVEGYSIVEICNNVFNGHNEITKVTFPSTLKKIGNNAFDSCFKLTAIELPEGIETIGSYAFHWCNSLASNELTIPASVKYIGDGAFFDCGIQTVYVKCPENTDWASGWSNTISNVYWNYKDTHTDEQGVTYILHNDNTATVWSYEGTATTLSFAVEGYTVTKIRERVFENNTSLTSVTLPEGLLEIGDYAFSQCSKLQTINLPEGLTVIREYAFYWCTNLQSIVLPDSLTTIETFAFYNTGLTSLIIPANVTSIGHAAFHSINVQNIYVKRAEATENYDQGWHNRNTDDIIWNFKDFHTDAQGITYVLFNDNTAHAISYSGNATALDFALDGYTVTKISSNLIANTNNGTDITQITLHEGLLVIEEYAFWGCTKLEGLIIPASVTTIHYNAFQTEQMLYARAASRPEGWSDSWVSQSTCVIWNYKEHYVDSTNGVTYVLCNDNTAIAVSFDGSVKEVVIGVEGYTVTALGKDLFKNRTTLTKVTLPEGLTEIGDHAFDGCQRLSTLSLPTTLKKIGSYAFTDCFGLVSLNFGAGLTEVGERAFSNCTGLTSISFDTGLTTIGSYAFYHCTGLTSITLPDSVTTIHSYAFEDCIKLPSIDLPEGLTVIPYGCFQNCTVLTSVSFPSGLKRIEESAFSGCNKLATVELPVGLEHIGSYAFRNCTALQNVEIPNGVTYIGWYAFNGCQSLGTVTIPESVVTIEYDVFWNCGELIIFCRSVSQPSGWSASWKPSNATVVWNAKSFVTDENGVYYAIRNDGTAVAISYSGSATELTLGIDGYTLTEIGKSIFQNNTTLTSVTVPEGVTSIWQNAFYGCTNLVTVNLPATLKTIGEYAFYNCKKLASIELPQNLTAIGQYAFHDCDALTAIAIPEGMTELTYHVFYECDTLKTVTLPSTLTTIRSFAFGSCINLPSIIIPESVTTVDSAAFSNCQSIVVYVCSLAKPSGWSSNWLDSNSPVVWDFKELVVKDGVTYAILNDGTAIVVSYSGTAEELTLGVEGYTLTEIVNEAFYNCDTLKKIVIPEGVEVIGARAFASCDLLFDVSLPSTLTTIGDRAFESSQSLCRVVIPSGVTYVGTYAFLTNADRTIVFAGMAAQPNDWGYGWKHDNTQVVWNFKEFKIVDGITYAICNDQTAVVVEYSGATEELTLALEGYTVKEIFAYAFSGNTNIKKVVIPNGVSIIGPEAFYNCSNLTEVSIPSSLKMIGPYAFSNTALAYVRLNDGLLEIGDSAFSNTRLSGLFIPSTVTYIGTWAFSNTNLKCVCIPASVTIVGEYAFQNNPELHIYHSAEASATGSWGYYWSGEGSFTHFEVQFAMDSQGVIYQLLENNTANVIGFQYNGTNEIVIGLEGYTVTSINRYAFAYSPITSVVIPEGMRAIGGFAFSHCGALRSVKLSSTVNSIYVEAFSYCNSLTEIVIPTSVTLIETWAFYSENGIKFYAEAAGLPDQWQSSWCVGTYEVVWGYTPTPEEQA